MSESDRPTVHVRLRGIDLQRPQDGQRLRREGLVELDQIDLVQREAGAPKRLGNRFDRAEFAGAFGDDLAVPVVEASDREAVRRQVTES